MQKYTVFWIIGIESDMKYNIIFKTNILKKAHVKPNLEYGVGICFESACSTTNNEEFR